MLIICIPNVETSPVGSGGDILLRLGATNWEITKLFFEVLFIYYYFFFTLR